MRNSDIQRTDIQYHPILLLKMLGVAALYALIARLAIAYSTSGFVTLIWPTSGLALAVLLVGGRRYAWGVFFGALLAYTMVGKPFGVSIAIATGNTLEALLGAWLLTRDAKFDPTIRSLRDYLHLILLGGGVGSSSAALTGVTALLVSGFITSEIYFRELLQWWMGDVLGIILITPLILVCWQTKNAWGGAKRLAEATLLFGLTFVAGQIIFIGWLHNTTGLFELIANGYWMFLFVVLIAARLGTRETMIALNMMAVQALSGAYQRVGFFADDLTQTQLVNYWFYTVALSVVGMALATYFTERKLNEEVLLRSETRLRTLYDSTSDAVMLLDEKGFFDCNRATLTMFGCATKEEFCSKHPADLSPPEQRCGTDSMTLANQKIATAMEKGSCQFEWMHQRADTGKIFSADVLLNSMELDGKTVLQATVRNITERKQAEDALDQFKYTLDQTLDSIFMFRESDFRFIYVNEGAIKQVGYTSAELLGMTPLDLKPEFTLERFQEMVQPLRDGTQSSLTFQTVHRHKNGRDIPLEVFLQLVRKEGAESRFMAIVRDITERKQAEDTLRKLSQAVEQSPNSIVITDLSANIEYVNQAFFKETGYSFDEAIGMNPRLLNSGKNSKATYEEMWACLSRDEAWQGELINRRKDGSEYIESALISPVQQADGRVTHYLAIKENITKRKNNEAKIERLSRAYRLLSRVNEAIVRTPDRDKLFATLCYVAVESELFRFVWIGMLDEQKLAVIPVAYAGVEEGYMDKLNIRLDDEHTGYGPTGRAIRESIHVVCQDIEHDPSMTPWRDEALKRGYLASAAFPIGEAGGDAGTITVYAAETHFFTPDIIQLMLELAADVSFALDVFAERKYRVLAEAELNQLNVELEHRVLERTRQLELTNKELEAFSYSVSHDLRTPLRSIDGFSRVLSKNYYAQLDATGKDWLERVCRASQHMGRLIDDMLQLAQVARSPLKREQINLGNIAENVADDLCKTYPERQIRFVLQQDLIIHADPGLIRIVMGNLLGNAWKYTGKKTEAKIEFGACDIDGINAFFVRDNGAGFNMDYAHKLFGAFQRLHGADEFEGTGIGLATVQRIIHRHHGKVWAEAKEGLGATFYFTLPQKTQDA